MKLKWIFLEMKAEMKTYYKILAAMCIRDTFDFYLGSRAAMCARIAVFIFSPPRCFMALL